MAESAHCWSDARGFDDDEVGADALHYLGYRVQHHLVGRCWHRPARRVCLAGGEQSALGRDVALRTLDEAHGVWEVG